jgi:hypothetical protein
MAVRLNAARRQLTDAPKVLLGPRNERNTDGGGITATSYGAGVPGSGGGPVCGLLMIRSISHRPS